MAAPHTSKPPKWLMAFVEKVRCALFLGDWSIHVECTNEPNPDNGSADATCYRDPSYLSATIAFRTEGFRKERRSTRETVIHEVVHILNAERDAVVERLIEQLPEGMRSLAKRTYTEADERAVVRLARGMVLLVEQSEGEPGTPPTALPA